MFAFVRTLGVCFSLSFFFLGSTALAQASDKPLEINIPAGNLADSLEKLGDQSGLQIMYEPAVAKGIRVAAINGTLTARDALAQLLAQTDLKGDQVNDKTIVLRRAEAQVDKGQVTSGGAETNSGATSEDTKLQEIVVTATKRAERVQDVPLSIAVVGTEDIERRGLFNSADYLRGIPGVNQVDTSINQTIVIRGIESATMFQNFGSGPTTATYFGEVPTTNAAGLFGGSNVDLKLVDIARVEVLRGPQGTAFGNSSMGGAVRTIPVAPRLDRFEGKLATLYSSTASGGDNYNVQGIANFPLVADRLALRAAAYHFKDGGYYENRAGSDPAFQAAAAQLGAQAVAIDEEEAGDYTVDGGRLAALWQLNDDARVTLSYLTQKAETDGVVGSRGGNYRQLEFQVAPQHARPGQTAGYFNSDIDIANATIEYDLGWANLVAAYSDIRGGSLSATNQGTLSVSQLADSDHREHVGELRIVTQLDGRLNFLAGLYAEDVKDGAVADNAWSADPATITLPTSLGGLGPNFVVGPRSPVDMGLYVESRRLKQKAAFGEVSWKLAPSWTLTGGVRAYDYDRSFRLDNGGGFYGAGTHIGERTEHSGSNYRANLSYKPTESALLYAGWSQGFRLGRLQTGLPATQCDMNNDGIVDGTNLPMAATRNLDPDELDNYELGAKFALFGNRMTLAADVFRMEWSEMPVRITPVPVGAGPCGGRTYFDNVGASTSEGVELEANVQLSEPVRIYFGGSWMDAIVAEDEPLLAPEGTRLPGAPKVNANFGVEYEFAIGGHDAFVRADSIYVGDFFGGFPGAPGTSTSASNIRAGDYFRFDATARIAIRNFGVELFVRNLLDEDAFTYSNSALNRYQLRPRTFGVQLSYNFGNL